MPKEYPTKFKTEVIQRYKDSRGDYHDICFPCTKEARQQFNDAVLDAYEQSFRQPQQTNHAPATEQTM